MSTNPMARLPDDWHPKRPTPEALIEQLILDSPMQLPEVYIDLLRASNGGYAEFSRPPWTIDFWAAQDILPRNQEYGVVRSAPDYLAFGSNLGEELVAFNRREGTHSGIYMLPWHAPNAANVLRVFPDFESLINTMKREEGI